MIPMLFKMFLSCFNFLTNKKKPVLRKKHFFIWIMNSKWAYKNRHFKIKLTCKGSMLDLKQLTFPSN